MIDDRLINRISQLMKDLSPRQKIILNQIIESKSFKIIEHSETLMIKTKTGDLYELIRYIKSN